MNASTLRDLLLGLFFILLEVMIFQHLSFFAATPDLVLIYLLWLALKYNRLQLILFAAFFGFLQDALFDYWGLHMFAKTLLCFLFYNFLHRRSESRLLLWQIMVIIFLAAFIHNIIFISLSSFINSYEASYIPIIFLLLNSLYTAVVGSLLFIFKGN